MTIIIIIKTKMKAAKQHRHDAVADALASMRVKPQPISNISPMREIIFL